MAGFYRGLIGCEEAAKLIKSELKIYFVCELEKDRNYSTAVAECLGPAHRTAMFHLNITAELSVSEQETGRIECTRGD